MSWFKRKEYIQGLVTLGVFLDEHDSDFKTVTAEFAQTDFRRVVISGGDFSNLDILSDCAARLEMLMVQGSVTTSFTGLEKLTRLVDLHCDVVSKKPYADFSSLVNLESCFLDWDKKYDAKAYRHGLFLLPKLKHLTLRHWTKSDCNEISRLAKLEKLRLLQGALSSLDGLNNCTNLRILELSYLPKLTNINRLMECQYLENIRIENCPNILDLTPITFIKNLRELHVEKTPTGFNDLSGLAQASKLEKICLSTEIRKIDWDILFNHPTLSDVVISSHDNYNVSDTEILKIAESASRKVKGFWRTGSKKRPSFAFNLA